MLNCQLADYLERREARVHEKDDLCWWISRAKFFTIAAKLLYISFETRLFNEL